MARGWESKDVESQQDLAEQRAQERMRPQMSAEEREKQARRESLRMDEKRLEADLGKARHPKHREQIEAALGHVRGKLGELEG
ncbi:MAG: hypothetical protein JNK48_01815 [Bryobacterales bacterium]|nr:hypothetical protein [Bryobacterales bacterium]